MAACHFGRFPCCWLSCAPPVEMSLSFRPRHCNCLFLDVRLDIANCLLYYSRLIQDCHPNVAFECTLSISPQH